MVTSLKNLKNEVDSRLAGGGLTDLACCQLQNADIILNNNIVTSVANTASLPNTISNEGRFVYVEDINEYRMATDGTWTDDVSSEVGVYQIQVWGWGGNASGQLGDGTITSRCFPVREISFSSDWRDVGAGCAHTAAIKTSGELWAWGNNGYGRLGDGTTELRCSPVREFCSGTDWCQVSAGGCHNAAIKTSGQLWAWGAGSQGLLGDGTTANRNSPVREFCSATNWCQVSAFSHTAAIKTSGELWVWGNNGSGRLGDGTITSRCSPVREFCSGTDWCQVNGGNFTTAAVKTSGELWAWGRNICGNLGDGTIVDTCSPVREICSATDWCQVSTTYRHSIAVKTSGQIWSWGRGSEGELGDGTTTQSCSPVREICSAADWCQVTTGYRHSAAIKTSGQIWSWGRGSGGQLGDGTTATRCSPVREISFATGWCQVSAHQEQTVAIKLAVKGFLE